ncbi:MAG TPA: alpha-L-fucosidase [Bryobacteraceae bacterium]|nr:alpha-L-fucosidase [Bryobacteraceae bacterium]
MSSISKLLIGAALALSAASAQPSQAVVPDDQRTQWWENARFGMFLHWGGYAVIGRDEWAREMFHVPQAEYDSYVRRLNPVHYDPAAWVKLAKNAGVRYMVITSKHHEGFSMFRTRYSDYGIAMTPYPGDPLKMLAEAARRADMPLGFYYSIMDWHHPDYEPKRAWEPADPNVHPNLDRYIHDFAMNQVRELLSAYGDIAVMWFDGQWEHTSAEMHSDEIYEMIRGLQPNTLINDRLFHGPSKHHGDFGTPEQFVPATGLTDASGKPMLWEACATINTSSWGYNKYETEFKSSRDLIRMLIEVASKGGNLLLNVGPKPDGTIQDEFVTRLNGMGDWLKVNGAAIYGTKASPFPRLPFFGRATQKGNVVYLHVFQWPADGKLHVPGLRNLIHSARLLADPAVALPVTRDDNEIVISLPKDAPDDVASVVELTLDGAADPAPWSLRPDARGAITLGAESAEIQSNLGQRAKKENILGHVFLTNWTRTADVPSWIVHIPHDGLYSVHMTYAAGGDMAGAEFTLESGAASMAGKTANTGGDYVFKAERAGQIALKAGEQTIRVKRVGRDGAETMRLERIVLTPAG